ncbi:hypothetical protein Efla_001762 [Eimeria flavescens]
MALEAEKLAADASKAAASPLEVETKAGLQESQLEHFRPGDATTTSNSSLKATQHRRPVWYPWLHAVSRQFCHEAKKVLHLQMDCGLYGSDWRIVYGGGCFRFLGPCLLFSLRAAVLITHLTALLVSSFYDDMLYFTTWTNLVALAFFFTATLLSMAAIGSLSRQRRLSEESVGANSCVSSLACFDRAEVQYQLLMNSKGEANAAPFERPQSLPPMRRCFAFRRPFSGSPRKVALEALLTSKDITLFLALPLVTVMFLVYWSMLYPRGSSTVRWNSVYLHLFSPVAAWALAALSRCPYRLSLVPLCVLLGACYIIMIVVVQKYGHGYVYWFLNFYKRPGLASGISLALLLAFGPGVACVAWVILFRKTAAVVPPL